MTTTDAFEALMPTPAVRAVYATAKNTPAVKIGAEMSGYMKSPDYYTADQMRAMFDAATERAAKQEREECAKAIEAVGPKEGALALVTAGFAAAIRARDEGVSNV